MQIDTWYLAKSKSNLNISKWKEGNYYVIKMNHMIISREVVNHDLFFSISICN